MKNILKKVILISSVVMCISAQAQTVRKYIVVMRSNVGTATMWDNKVLRIFGFAPSLSAQPTLPGVTLYAEEGDSVYIDARAISQGDEHTVHLHGFDSNPTNDGDPLSSHPIGHLQSRIYAYKATHCGTFIYHCHVDDVVHVQMGMYGLFIVKPKGGLNNAWTGGPAYNKEYSWLMSEIDQKWHENIPVYTGYPVADTLMVPPFNPNYFLINGKSEQQIRTDSSITIGGLPNEFIYLRTANIGYYTNQIVFPPELKATIIDSDGRPLPHAIRNDTVNVMPGERYGVMLQCSSDFNGFVNVNYVNMATDSTWNTQKVPVRIGTLGIKKIDLANSLLSVYPNPASNVLEVVLYDQNDLKNNEYAIVNSIGQVVAEGNVVKEASTTNSFTINVNQLNSGSYYLRLSLKDQFLYKKIIIAK